MACVPTDKLEVVKLALPPETAADAPAVEIGVAPSNNCAMPAGVPPVTVTLNVKAVPEGSLSAFTVIAVVVAVVPPPPPPPYPPLQPSVKVRMQTRPKPSAACKRLRPPGRKMRKSAARPVPALSASQPFPVFLAFDGDVSGAALAS